MRVAADTRKLLLAIAALLLMMLMVAGGLVTSEAASAKSKPALLRFATEPSLTPPEITMTRSATPAPGYFFLAPEPSGISAPWVGAEILDDRGQPVWLETAPKGMTVMDFQVQTYQGEPVLTYWRGSWDSIGMDEGVWVIKNSAYKTIATVDAGNGYQRRLA